MNKTWKEKFFALFFKTQKFYKNMIVYIKKFY